MPLPMTRRLILSLAALCLGGAAACVDLEEKPVTQITSAYYSTPAGFEAAVTLSEKSFLRGLQPPSFDVAADGRLLMLGRVPAALATPVEVIVNWRDHVAGRTSP